MAYVIKLTHTKPDEELWFSQVKEPILINQVTTKPVLALQDFDRWTKDQPGYISSFAKLLNPTTVESVYIFDTKENGDAWNRERKNHPFQKAQDEYFSKSSIATVETIY
jgi:hypothetical protein